MSPYTYTQAPLRSSHNNPTSVQSSQKFRILITVQSDGGYLLLSGTQSSYSCSCSVSQAMSIIANFSLGIVLSSLPSWETLGNRRLGPHLALLRTRLVLEISISTENVRRKEQMLDICAWNTKETLTAVLLGKCTGTAGCNCSIIFRLLAFLFDMHCLVLPSWYLEYDVMNYDGSNYYDFRISHSKRRKYEH